MSAGNTFGQNLKITTWGESHGPALGVVIDGFPPGIYLNEKDIQKAVNHRKPKKNSKISTTRIEEDKIQILSGIFKGKTTGTPISIIIENSNKNSKDYEKNKNSYRPGHADFTYDLKYGFRDYRGGGRSSGRETLTRVIAGSIAKKIIPKIKIFGHTIQVGNIKAKTFSKNEIEKNEIKCADKKTAKEMIKLIEKTHIKENDSIGAIIEIIVKNPPAKLGDPVFNKLDAELAKALMSIGAIKGIEIGSGFSSATMKGSENNDQMEIKNNKIKFLSNNSGGILGGISTGEDIIIRLAIKPVPSINKELKTISKNTSNKTINNTFAGPFTNTTIKTIGRHDSCLAPRIIPVAEAMTSLVLADFLLNPNFSSK